MYGFQSNRWWMVGVVLLALNSVGRTDFDRNFFLVVNIANVTTNRWYDIMKYIAQCSMLRYAVMVE